MSKRLLCVLLSAALAAAMLAGLTVPATPASAELRTVTVQLADGSTTTVTVDVPPGTPLQDVQIPVPTPTVPLPVPVPNPTDPGSPAPVPSPSPSPNPDQGSQPGGQQSDQTPNASNQGGTQQTTSGTKEKAKRNALDQAPNAQPQDEVKKKLDKINEKLRNPDGSPAPSNPTYFDALPGPAVASGVPNFVIQKFRVPIFLLPIYQAAGIQYGIRWEVLAAINEIETDYGRNLNVSSAGAVGWMQFMPSTWKMYGVDANKDGRKDPFNPVDAIFASARYLRAAGGDQDIQKAVFAYNHAGWYVDSVMLRARMIAGVPADLVGSLTGLTEGHFPVYARARYADDLAEKDAIKRVKRGANAANVIASNESRQGIDIFARRGAPVVAVNDGVVKKIGVSKKIGRYVVLQDVYGNQYTYGNLGRVSRLYPIPKSDLGKLKTTAKALQANLAQKRKDPKPTAPASAGRQLSAPTAASQAKKRVAAKAKKSRVAAADPAPAATAVERERLFAHPTRPEAKKSGGLEQILLTKAKRGAYATFDNVSSRPLRFDPKRMRLTRLKKGSHVIGGTVLGRIGAPTSSKASHIYFQIRPAGKGAPMIDPKPILDGWKLLEATAIYRASGRNALYDPNGSDNLSIGQVMLLPKSVLEKRVLEDPRLDIYAGGREDIRTGQIDRRVLATLEYLAESGFNSTVTALKTGHGYLTASGNVSEHSSGNAVDIAMVNGIPILGHQEPGGIADQVVHRLMLLQGTMQPHQIISLLDYGANTFAMSDHADHIHIGFKPLFGNNSKLGLQALAVLKPGQWNNLVQRLSKIDNPVVPTKPSKFAIKVPSKHRSSSAHVGD